MKPRSGFTLIEMTIVLAICGMIVILAPNLMQWMQLQGVGHAVDQLRADLLLARTMAINHKKTCTIRFNYPGPGQYTNLLTNRMVNLSQYRGGVHFMPKGPDNDAMSGQINFTRRGMAAPAGDVYLSDRQNQRMYRLRVLVPGGISIFRWGEKQWQ
jgi:prepilin-type N-terminal cleavage/methylation domain-containing protein